MKFGNAAFELAERRAEQERDAGVARVQAELRQARQRPVKLVCDCGNEISVARRAAMPGAEDCIDCATFRERQARRYA